MFYYVFHLRGGGYCFWCGSQWHWHDTGMTLFCLHNILWTICWILTKFSWIYMYNWDITNNWLDFGDLNLIFKVTAVEKIEKCLTLSCLQNILGTSNWILTFSWIYNWNIKIWLQFSEVDLIFKVTAVEKLKIQGGGTFFFFFFFWKHHY